VRAAEQLPLALLPAFVKMQDGQSLFNRTPTGAQVIVLVGARPQAVDEDRARQPIENFLMLERRRKVVDDDLKALRAAAKIEYVGDYAKTAQEKAAADKAALEVKPSVSVLTGDPSASAPLVESRPSAVSPLIGTPASAPEPTVPITPASAPSGKTLDQGLKGLK